MTVKRLEKTSMVAFVALLVIIGVLLFMTPKSVSAADTEVKPSFQFDVNTSMADNLVALKGKSVTITLSPGQSITGIVEDVKGNLLHLSKMSQREFYDALISIDHISAIEMKVR
jgi:hypothetical protein